jgi:UDP-N-acetylmuramyl pentapeptide phosphotransferase/UDP-N-acetylglucosamine-1-phosphate transferase
MVRSTQIILGSMIIGVCLALMWFNAPIVPTLLGAVGAGGLLYWRSRDAVAR